MDAEKTIAVMRMVGGHPCLDFVNTVDSRGERWGPDLWRTYADLIDWAQRAEVIDEDVRGKLLAAASRRPAAARTALDRAKMLREAVYALLYAEASDRPVPASELKSLNEFVTRAMSKRSLKLHANRPTWGWTDSNDLDAVSYRVAFAASEFIVSAADRRPVRECTGPNCGWLFLDTSRGGRRRWCSDETCGTHSRVRRFRNKLEAADR